jgi:hypothetical protein
MVFVVVVSCRTDVRFLGPILHPRGDGVGGNMLGFFCHRVWVRNPFLAMLFAVLLWELLASTTRGGQEKRTRRNGEEEKWKTAVESEQAAASLYAHPITITITITQTKRTPGDGSTLFSFLFQTFSLHI